MQAHSGVFFLRYLLIICLYNISITILLKLPSTLLFWITPMQIFDFERHDNGIRTRVCQLEKSKSSVSTQLHAKTLTQMLHMINLQQVTNHNSVKLTFFTAVVVFNFPTSLIFLLFSNFFPYNIKQLLDKVLGGYPK